MFAIMFIFIIDTVIYVIITLISGFSKEYKELNTQYKNIVIKKIINNFYDNLEYFPYKSMPEYIYESATEILYHDNFSENYEVVFFLEDNGYISCALLKNKWIGYQILRTSGKCTKYTGKK